MRSIYSYEPAERLKYFYSIEGALDNTLLITFLSSSNVGAKVIITTLAEVLLGVL